MELVTSWLLYAIPSLSPSPSLSDVAEKAEGSLMLHSINELREHQPPSQGDGANVVMATTPIYHTLALLHTVVGEYDKVNMSEY